MQYLMRSAFMNRIADEVPNPDMLIFTDEAARISLGTD
jgi:hypothetical protein